MKAVPSSVRHILKQGAALLLVTGVALAARCPGLGLEVLSSDESFSWRLTGYPVSELVRRTGVDVHPPLYYLLLKSWVAVWGSSSVALRGLSLLFSVLCVPLLYAVCREAWLYQSGGEASPTPSAWLGALFAAALVALHATEVGPGRNARMYAIGTFFAGLTAWLLLRALRSQRRQWAWWSLYGIAVAAFCYTHYYAFFTVLAQAAFVGVLAVSEWRAGRPRKAAGLIEWLLLAGAVAFLLYLPWLQVLRSQVQQVRQDYWLSPITAHAAEVQFFSWATGIPYQGSAESYLLLTLVAASVAATLWQRSHAGWFFLLQWSLPWILGVGVSALSGRTIFLERYMAFAHFSFLAHVTTVVWWNLPRRVGRAIVASALIGCCLYGLRHAADHYPLEASALANAAEFLKENYQPVDLVLTDSAHSLNRIRYYLEQQGMTSVVLKCKVPWQAGQGHFTHVASLETEDLWWEEHTAQFVTSGRIWWASESGGSGLDIKEGLRMDLHRTFEGGGTRFTLVLYCRRGK
jgi:mannosyltransferase